MNTVEMVCGFMFGYEIIPWQRVLLIQKNHPDWQKGKFNGIGGKIESETITHAMVREFKEETGLQTREEQWEYAVTLQGNDWVVHFLRTSGPIDLAKKIEEEVPVVVSINNLYNENVIPNLRWLIPLCTEQHLSVPIFIRDQN